MTYVKPEVVASNTAIRAIQRSTCKISQFVLDIFHYKGTTAAYEADE